MNLYSLRHLRSQVDALQKRLKPVLAILRLRNLAMEFCDELDESDLGEPHPNPDTRSSMCIMFPSRIGQAGFRLDTFGDLNRYLHQCIDNRSTPDPREMVFTLIPWAKKGPHLRPDLWDRPAAA